MLIALLLGLDMIAPARARVVYDVINLGPLYGRTGEGPAINELGHVTGYAEPASVPYGYGHAFLYSGGVTIDLGTLGGHTSRGWGINDLDQVIGYSAIDASGTYRAFLYSGGRMTDLGTLGGDSSVGLDINNLGMATGWAQTTSQSTRAFLYTSELMFDLGALGGDYSAGYGINESGQVTGYFIPASGNPRAFLYSGGSMIDLGTLGGPTSYGEAINNRGDVTGSSMLASGATHAFLYTAGGLMLDLGAPSGGSSLGKGINDLGDVVGIGGSHAYLWTFSDGAMHDLNDLIDPASGWVLRGALDINNAGQITGYGTFNGTTSAFLLTPTEYQIQPNPNPDGSSILVDDPRHGYFNAEFFENEGYIGINGVGRLENRAGATLSNQFGGTVENAGTFRVSSGGSFYSSSFSALLNHGLMFVDGTASDYGSTVNDGFLSISANGRYTYGGSGGTEQFLNQGEIENAGLFVVTGSGARLSSTGGGASFSNAGTLRLEQGGSFAGKLQNTGTVLVRDGGHYSGPLNNGGQFTVTGASSFADTQFTNDGAMSLKEGALFTVDAYGGDGISYNNGGLEVGTSGGLLIRGAGLVNASTGALAVRPAATVGVWSRLENQGTIVVDGRLNVNGRLSNFDSILVGAGGALTLVGEFQNTGSVDVNAGTLDITPSGRVFGPGQVTLTDGLLIVNGSFAGNTVNAYNSVVMGSNRIEASATVNLFGSSLNAGNSPGTLILDGALNMDNASSVIVEIASPDDHDRLVLGGAAHFDATRVQIVFLDGYRPDAPEGFDWLSANSGWSGSFYYAAPVHWTVSFSDSASGARLWTTYQFAYEVGAPTPGEDIGIPVEAVAYVGEYGNLASYGALRNSGVLHIRDNAALWNGGQVFIDAGAWMVNRGRLDLSASYGLGQLHNAGTVYNHATGTVVNDAVLENSVAEARLINRGRLQNWGGIINNGLVDTRGQIDNGGFIENHGDFVIGTQGRVKGSGSYQQWSGSTRVDGVLASSDSLSFQAGILTGDGTLIGQVYLGNISAGPVVRPGASIGTMTIEGDLTVDNALFEIDVAGVGNHDILTVSGTALFHDGQVTFLFLDGYAPVAGNVITWLTTGHEGGGFASLDYAIWSVGESGVRTPWSAPPDLLVRFHGDRLAFTAAPVPEPESWAMVLAGLGLVGWAASRHEPRLRRLRVSRQRQREAVLGSR
jgi:probable HAF family extracellular repeat protein